MQQNRKSSPTKRANLHTRNIAYYTLTFVFVSVNVWDLLLTERRKKKVGKTEDSCQ